MPTAKANRISKKLDREIERIYYAKAQGVQIDVMNIRHVFRAGYEAAAKGESIEAAVLAAVAQYREN